MVGEKIPWVPSPSPVYRCQRCGNKVRYGSDCACDADAEAETAPFNIERDPISGDWIARRGRQVMRVPEKLVRSLSNAQLWDWIKGEFMKRAGTPKFERDLYEEPIGPLPLWELAPPVLWPRCERHNKDAPAPGARCRCLW